MISLKRIVVAGGIAVFACGWLAIAADVPTVAKKQPRTRTSDETAMREAAKAEKAATQQAAAPTTQSILNPEYPVAFAEADKAIEGFKTAPGLKVTTFAAEPQLANAVALWMDDKGRAWVAETFRFNGGGDGTGVYDIRHMYERLDEDLACKTVEQRLEAIKRWHKGDLSEMTQWPDRLRLIEDRDGDGKADFSSIFAEFKEPLDGVASGVIVRGDDVYVTNIPDLLLMRDTDGDGKADTKKSLSTGYGVRYSFLGHDLHGLRWGPDGRLYFSNGDRGLHVTTAEGKVIDVPDTGCVLRCEADGSNLELFATGLRNPQKLVFDQWGNLFTGDNNADYGDPARWVYVVEGGDSGWRVGYQHLKTPRAGGPWLAEGLTEMEKPGGPAYRLPPIGHVATGPSGCTYYPGTGLGEKFDGHFFLTDFRAGPASVIHSFALKPKGASFEVTDLGSFLEHVSVTDIEFGPDSSAYVTDWIGGFVKTAKGRIYRVSSPELEKSEAVVEVKRLLTEGMSKRSAAELIALLGHRDMRVRQGAQFELAGRGSESVAALTEAALQSKNRLARVHAVWGLSQIERKNAGVVAALTPLLADADEEVRAQSAKVLGEAKFAGAYEGLGKLLADQSSRVRFFAAMSLGKLGRREATSALLKLVEENADKDAFLRHAAVMGLAGIGDTSALVATKTSASPSVRIAAVLALRMMGKSEVGAFLNDSDLAVVTEAARAINDVPIEGARAELAKLIENPKLPEPVLLRALNANFRLGAKENAAAVVSFAGKDDAPEILRVESIAMLKEWDKPRGVDRVTGLWWPLKERDASIAADAVRPAFKSLMTKGPDGVRVAAIELLAKVGGAETAGLFDVVTGKDTPGDVGAAALSAMEQIKSPQLSQAVDHAMRNGKGALRIRAIGMLAGQTDAIQKLEALLAGGSIADQQAVLDALGQIDKPPADEILGKWMDKLLAGTVAPELHLELINASRKEKSPALMEKVKQFNDRRSKDGGTTPSFIECLYGGNSAEGKKIFFERQEVSCMRCHKVGPEGGIVGPNLSDVGLKRDRKYILESILLPNQQIATGFEAIRVQMKTGRNYNGVVKTDGEKELILDGGDGATIHILKSEVGSRTKGLSGMPDDIAKPLKKRELRDLVEFLASQKTPTTQPATMATKGP